MCPLYPFHFAIFYLLVLVPLSILCASIHASALFPKTTSRWKASFKPEKVEKLKVSETRMVEMYINGLSPEFYGGSVEVFSEDTYVASVTSNSVLYLSNADTSEDTQVISVTKNPVLYLSDPGLNSFNWSSSFNLTGNFLGFTNVKLRLRDQKKTPVAETPTLPVTVVRPRTALDKAFSYSVAVLVSVAYINMGCALDLDVVKKTIKKPLGPAIGFLSQYLAMPLMSFGLAKLLFKMPAMQLGMFVTGCSPGGGGSNMWTYILGGNLNLSITMTFLSTVGAFGMMPLWIFTLGQVIFKEGDIVIPYYKIATFVLCLIVPLGIGLLIKRCYPKLASFLKLILKPMAVLLILFIITFGIYTNVYMFHLFTWQIIVAGLGLPWLGYCFGAGLAKLFRMPWEDILAVGIETGIQNTGLSIFILWFTLDQPEADLTTVVPVAAATFTPFPLLLLYIIQRVQNCLRRERKDGYRLEQDDLSSPSSLSVVDSNEMLTPTKKKSAQLYSNGTTANGAI